MAEYDYDANGNCKIIARYDNGIAIANPSVTHISNVNPFRWKAYYYDSESGLYYVNGRYYNPELGKFMDADNPENLLAVAYMLNSLDRNAVTVDNLVNAIACMWNIFTATELACDPADPNAKKTWWDVHWKQFVNWAMVVISVLMMFVPGAQGIAVGMLVTSLSGMIIGGIIGGLTASANGSSVWEGITDGMVTGFTIGVVAYSIFDIVTGIFNVIAAATAAADAGILATRAVVANATREGMSLADEDFVSWLNSGERNTVVYKGISDLGDEVYTGITRQGTDVRLYQHNLAGKNFSRLDELYSGLTTNQARSIETYRILTDGTSQMNMILSISRTHRFFEQAMEWASLFRG